MRTIGQIERELARTWREANENGVPPHRWEQALWEMGGLDPGDIVARVRQLTNLVGPDAAVAWLEGLRDGLFAAMAAEVSRATPDRVAPRPTRRERLATLAWALAALTLVAAWLLALVRLAGAVL